MSSSRRGFLTAVAVAGMASGELLARQSAARAAGGTPVARQTTPREETMRTILSEGLGRIVILSLDRGEKLREAVRDKLRELGIKNAVLAACNGSGRVTTESFTRFCTRKG